MGNITLGISQTENVDTASDATTAATTAKGRMGQVCYSITRRGQGMGSLERGREAAQWQRFQQGSVPGDAGCPSAFDAFSSLEHSNDPARLRRWYHERDAFAVQGSVQGWLYPKSLLFPCVSVLIQDATSDE